MDNKSKKKCSLKKHSESNAISYCQQCKIYLCNKCHKLHPEVLDNHTLINIDKDINESFIDICQQKGHNANYKLEFYCKNHNILCCLACLCKIKVEGYSQHSDCDCCHIKEIQVEKRSKLKENIKYLEDFSNKFEQSINELKILFEKINKD